VGKLLKFLFGLIVVIAVVAVVGRIFFFELGKTQSYSMVPTLVAGDIFIVSTVSLLGQGDIAVCANPDDPSELVALRILGIPGDDPGIVHGLAQVEDVGQVEERLDLLERSTRADTADGQQEIAELTAEVDATSGRLEHQLDSLQHDIDDFSRRLLSARLVLRSGADDLEVPLANVLEVVWPNRLGVAGRTVRALREFVAFLFTEPREANTEGGIFPALFGTVLLVLLMSVAVVPLGVVTAVYMTEYARPGILLRLANQAVNNLAGVPSIVFGMFGLAFFVYQVGGSIDAAFFADRLPTPTFGTGGLLWASLTLALLTVPVVVVATREGLMAVPQSWRDGSLALGATRWQTLKRIILPAATPGILTGLILAVSRAAGEVAPLMLTGAVKLAPSLPVDGVPPFLHLQRKFMHLGFHIYDVSMQSPNVEAAKPMAFATTLVLLALVVLLNLTAIIVRRRLRRAYRGQVV